jgi:hypothetical protein
MKWRKDDKGNWRCGAYRIEKPPKRGILYWIYLGKHQIGVARTLNQAKDRCHDERFKRIEEQAHAHSA